MKYASLIIVESPFVAERMQRTVSPEHVVFKPYGFTTREHFKAAFVQNASPQALDDLGWTSSAWEAWINTAVRSRLIPSARGVITYF